MEIDFNRNNYKVFQINFAVFLVLLMFAYFSYEYIQVLPEFIINNKIERIIFSSAVMVVMAFLTTCFISVFIENWRSSFWIKIKDDNIIGFSFRKKLLWCVNFNDIEQIYQSRGYNPKFIFLSAVIIDKKGNILLISVDVEKFGTLMELIQSKAVNVKKIDFGDWPKNWLVWKK